MPTSGQAVVEEQRSALRTGRGKMILLLLAGVQFLDIVDGAITNVALPSIQRGLHFSQQNLQWVASGYLLTYGGFLLLGGRVADLLGRRRILVSGLVVFAFSSLAGGLAQNEGMLIGARIVQGVGAAMMAPAALSILTTTFREGRDRNTALGVWGAIAGLGAATGVFLGGVLSEGPGWRWVLLVNLPVCAIALGGSFRLLPGDRRRARFADFDLAGAVLVTGGMLLLVYTLIKAPDVGWASGRTIGMLVASAMLLGVFLVNEQRSRKPLAPLSIFRIKGLAAADLTQLAAFAGFFALFFFFLTLYMQEVLGYSPIKAGAAYLPVTATLAVSAGLSSQLFARIGTRPVTVAGLLFSGGGMFYLSRVPLHGSYLPDLLPGLMIMAFGLGAVFVSVTAAANAGVPADKAGLAAGLLNASQQLGMALGLAVLSAIASARTSHLLGEDVPRVRALTSGYHYALLTCAIFVAVAALIAARTPNARVAGPPVAVSVATEPALS
jgi:EmrB/QacA subfamily drug resistance transporter